MAATADRLKVRFLRFAASPNALKTYQPLVSKLLTDFYVEEKAEAVRDSRGVKETDLPPNIPGMKPGGPLRPGIYAGNAVSDGKLDYSIRVYLFETGEHQICNEKGEPLKYSSGHFRYDPITGMIDIERTSSLGNDSYDLDEQFCVYGLDANNNPYIYSSEDRGFSRRRLTLKYAGPVDRLSPEQDEAAKDAAEKEKDRYKFVLPAGKSTAAASIEGVYDFINTTQQGVGSSSSDSPYVLFKDGAVYDGFPASPQEWDVSVSRRREPSKWGKWTKNGANIMVTWPDNPNRAEKLEADKVRPAPKGMTLNGTWSSAASGGDMITGSWYSFWGVTFTPDGRFKKFRRGGSSNGSLAQTMNNFYLFTSYDDEGSVVSSTSDAAVVSSVRKNRPGADRSGTYEIDGFTLILRFDNGTVSRLPFFLGGKGTESIYFEGSTMTFDDGK
jgi:hypothetical protein